MPRLDIEKNYYCSSSKDEIQCWLNIGAYGRMEPMTSFLNPPVLFHILYVLMISMQTAPCGLSTYSLSVWIISSCV